MSLNIFRKIKLSTDIELPSPELAKIEFSCNDEQPIWSYGEDDSVEVKLHSCGIASPSGNNICAYDVLIAIGVSSSNGQHDKEIIRAKNRGDKLAKHILNWYQFSCPSDISKPKLFVLNLGQPTNTVQDSRFDRALQAYVGNSVSDNTELFERLDNVIGRENFSHWEVTEIPYDENL